MPISELNFNFYNILIAAGIIHGLIFSVVLLSKKKDWKTFKLFLAFSVLALALNNLQYWFRDTKLNVDYPQLTSVYIQFELLVGPFFYLFVKRYLGKPIEKGMALLVLAPFILSSIALPLFSQRFFSADFEDGFNTVLELFTIVLNLWLICYIFYSIVKYERAHTVIDFNETVIQTKWLKHLLILTLIMCLLWLCTTLFLRQFIDAARSISIYAHYYPIWILTSLMLYWVAYASIFKARIFDEQKAIKQKKSSYSIKEIGLSPQLASIHIATSPKKKTNEELFKKFQRLVLEEELYLNPRLSLEFISSRLDISSNYLSQIVNNHSNYSFADYINTQRISLAKQLLLDPDFKRYTIQSIALETGFNSKSSFYNAFKKITDLTPTQYKTVQKSV